MINNMKKHFTENFLTSEDCTRGSRNWLLHTRYVRGEYDKCLELADNLQKNAFNSHRFAHYVKALIYSETGRLQEALDKFHISIKIQPQDPEALKQVANCLYRQGRYQLARDVFLEADKLSKHPDPEIYSGLAMCAENLDDVSHGIEWAKASVQAGGGERAGALLAKLLKENGNEDDALAVYDDVLALNACGADTLAAAGALRLRCGDPRRAFQLLGEALSQQPTQHAAALALAAMMLQHKDVDASLARLKAALTAHPTCVAAHTDLGLALLSKKKYIAALTCLQRAVWAAPLSARAAHDLGLVLLICKRPASAFNRLAAAAALQPSQPYTVLLIAISLERLDDPRADAAYSKAVSLDPEDALIRINNAARHARAGRYSEAAQEALLTDQLLRRENNLQLAASLALLMSLLRETGVELSADAIENTPISNTTTSPDNEDFAADEV
ncbi:Bardet-Biedl syndrome 4 protein homolog [Pieris rapae]|uniref:Bardet-Biedl syndrome 4 protein homolog n=1 Tax=Pieris rapae TaxID=64459 RepID=UPI001E280E7C|nr:Bardet-Biedl syndrome 4 protein homolog [Pieris rapae]